MIKIEPVIVAHIDRLAAGQALQRSLGPETLMAVDKGQRGDWGNHAQALQYGAWRDCTHVLLIEDDAVLSEDFRGGVQRAVEARPNDLISFYVGTGRPRQGAVQKAIRTADEQGSTWLEADNLLWGVCYVIPRVEIAPLLAWATPRAGGKASDDLVGAWWRQAGRLVTYSWPSLVDHSDGEPVIRGRCGRDMPRKAWRVGRLRPRGEPVLIQRGL